MGSAELKSEIYKLIDGADSNLLQRILIYASFLNKSKDSDWFNDLPLNIQKELKFSVLQDKKGETITNADIKKNINKRFPHLKL